VSKHSDHLVLTQIMKNTRNVITTSHVAYCCTEVTLVSVKHTTQNNAVVPDV